MKIKQRSVFAVSAEIIALILVCAIILISVNADNVKRQFDELEYPKYDLEYIGVIESASKEFGVEENFILAMIKAESNFDIDAKSRVGALGLMQIMPLTYETEIKGALNLHMSAKNALCLPSVNIRCGTYYISRWLKYYDDVTSALAAYNAGPGRVNEWLSDDRYSAERTDSKDGRVLIPENIPYGETRTYITRVMYYYEQYNTLYKSDDIYNGGEYPPAEKYKDSPILWITKPGYKDGQIIVNDLCCYSWAVDLCKKYYKDVDPILVLAIIKTESDFVVNAVSSSGAYGLMQIMPDTYNVDIKPSLGLDKEFEYLIEDPEFAVMCGTYYLHWLYAPSRQLNCSMINIAAAYNGGCNAVKEWLNTEGLSKDGELIVEKIPKAETKRYVEKVLANYEYFAELYS